MHYRRYGVAHYLEQVKAAGQIDCGAIKVPLAYRFEVDPTSLPGVTNCVNTALQRRRPFFLSVEGPGVDSYVATGLVGDDAGNIRRFWYDSAPCGSPHCREGFRVWSCPPVDAGASVDPNAYCPRPANDARGRTRG